MDKYLVMIDKWDRMKWFRLSKFMIKPCCMLIHSTLILITLIFLKIYTFISLILTNLIGHWCNLFILFDWVKVVLSICFVISAQKPSFYRLLLMMGLCRKSFYRVVIFMNRPTNNRWDISVLNFNTNNIDSIGFLFFNVNIV